ncbi:MAG: hypothetical protein IJH71_09220 [Eubacterium sp.]|nr:hypothetical protein [Eubacterium sp.]
MLYMKDEHYVISRQELDFVLAGVGVRKVFGFVDDPESSEEAGRTESPDADLHRVMWSLFQKNYISRQGNAVRIEEPLQSVVSLMDRADTCLIFDPADHPEDKLICYLKEDRALLMQKVEAPRDNIRFRFAEKGELADLLDRLGLLPDQSLMLADDRASGTDPDGDLLLTDVYVTDPATGRTMRKIRLLDHGLYTLEEWEMPSGEKKRRTFRKNTFFADLLKEEAAYDR